MNRAAAAEPETRLQKRREEQPTVTEAIGMIFLRKRDSRRERDSALKILLWK